LVCFDLGPKPIGAGSSLSHQYSERSSDRIKVQSAFTSNHARRHRIGTEPNWPMTVANGSRVANFNARSVWKNRLLSHLDRYKLYPDAVRAQRAKSIAFLNFGMDRDGRVLTFYLGRSSGCPDPDDETPAMIQRVRHCRRLCRSFTSRFYNSSFQSASVRDASRGAGRDPL
jgi:hypothetical protein